MLAGIPERYGIVRAVVRNFPPRPDDGAFFAERMTARLSAQAPINDPASQYSQYRPTWKVAHRGDASVVVERGNHSLGQTRFVPVRGWHPIEVLHFPIRSQGAIRAKGCAAGRGLREEPTWLRHRLPRVRREGRAGGPPGRGVRVTDARRRRAGQGAREGVAHARHAAARRSPRAQRRCAAIRHLRFRAIGPSRSSCLGRRWSMRRHMRSMSPCSARRTSSGSSAGSTAWSCGWPSWRSGCPSG